jgi:hypothetical protein
VAYFGRSDKALEYRQKALKMRLTDLGKREIYALCMQTLGTEHELTKKLSQLVGSALNL